MKTVTRNNTRGGGKPTPVAERFEAMVLKTPGCWLWQGSRKRHPRTGELTYGSIKVGGKLRLAHRVSWHLYRGADLDHPLKVCHSCDNPICVNPSHLFVGTQLDNVRDMHAKGRARKRAPKGEASPAAKLTDQDVRMIRTSTSRVRDLAIQLRVSHSVVSEARRRVTWKHIP